MGRKCYTGNLSSEDPAVAGATGHHGSIMASQWYSLVTQKLFLAKTLLDQLEAPAPAPRQEALTQGAVELMLRARKLLLVMIARHYQERRAMPGTLEELAGCIGPDAREIGQLTALAAEGTSWWRHLDQLEQHQSQPPATRKTVTDDNIIAIATEPGPDRSAAGLLTTLTALKQFAKDLEEWHSEW
jgi:hypothetical protein